MQTWLNLCANVRISLIKNHETFWRSNHLLSWTSYGCPSVSHWDDRGDLDDWFNDIEDDMDNVWPSYSDIGLHVYRYEKLGASYSQRSSITLPKAHHSNWELAPMTKTESCAFKAYDSEFVCGALATKRVTSLCEGEWHHAFICDQHAKRYFDPKLMGFSIGAIEYASPLDDLIEMAAKMVMNGRGFICQCSMHLGHLGKVEDCESCTNWTKHELRQCIEFVEKEVLAKEKMKRQKKTLEESS